MLGDPSLEASFEREIRGRVRSAKAQFTRDALREIRDNRSHEHPGLNIKTGTGGLREIQLLGLAAAVQLGSAGRVGPELYLELAGEASALAAPMSELAETNRVLRRIRDLHRLLVSFDDPLDSEVLLRIATDIPSLASLGPPPRLAADTIAHMERSARAVDAISALLPSIVP